MHIFSAIYDFLSNIWNNLIVLIFSSNNIVFDILDIVAVTFVIYKIIQFMRKTRAQQLLKGLIVFLAVYIVAKLLGLNAISWILSVVISNIIIVVAVLFQPEIRSILEKLGRQGISSAIKFSKNFEKEDASLQLIEIICKAVENMSKSRTGALIIIERKTMLNEIVNTGTILDAKSSVNLIQNIFFKNSPLHDGAMIIRDDRVYAASCILPLSQNPDISSELGTRHRASIGISETCDAIAIVVSEETGEISLAVGGEIKRGYSNEEFKEKLKDLLATNINTNDENENKFLKIFKKEVRTDEKD